MVPAGFDGEGGTLSSEMDDLRPDDSPGATDLPPARRWPLGLLSLLVVAVVAGGIVLFGGDEPDTPDVPDLSTDLGLDVQNGEPAPDFSLDLFDGTAFRLSDHLRDDGRPVILNLWASWCSPCRAEMPEFDLASQTHTDVLFLGIAVDDTLEAARAFADEVAVGYALAFDESDRVARRYFSPGLPATFFISSDGVIVRKAYGQLDADDLAQLIAESFDL